ncbi:MAG TPA: hypothetical protein VFE60_27300 [Roseiarcus sp.]|jgi:tetratricopeptide (TPR) repeat protein|nr:hypothetical protein [Roseiarcus sp.]
MWRPRLAARFEADNALIAARGYGAPETTEAFAKARESTSGDKDAPERLAADYGLWVGSATRGELPSMRAHAVAFLTAIAVAKQQGTRSFELRAALALAKLYQATARPAEAHAVLASALDGFAPTKEMPEIAEAQALLAALVETDEVKVEAAHRQRLTQLQVAYGNALLAARGYGAPETTEAFARARESAGGDKDAPGRLSGDYGLRVGSFTRGELPEMRAHAAAFLSDLEATPDSPEAGVAHRAAGGTCWFAGEYAQARDHLERALALFRPGRDDDMAFRFGQDPGVSAMGYLALVLWPLGEVDRAASLNSRMLARIGSLTHLEHACAWKNARGHVRIDAS